MRGTRPPAFFRLGVWMMFCGIAAPSGAWHLYTLEPLGDLGGGDSRAAAINHHDWVAGESASPSGSVEAFVWTPDEGIQPLGGLGGGGSRALDLNDDGVVVGEAMTTNGRRAFRWTKEGGMEALPATEQTWHSAALAINNLGHIVGTLEDERGMHAVLWEEDQLSFLHRLPGAGHVQPLDVNYRGDVVGHIAIGTDEAAASHAFYFLRAVEARHLAEFRLVSALAGSAAVAINDQGLAVGYVMLDSAHVRAFRYLPASGLELLEDHNALYTTATDINQAGWATGSAIASYASDESACIWQNGRWLDLNEITERPGDWWLVQATGINHQNVITGYGIIGDRNQAFVLRPTPDRIPGEWPVMALRIGKDREVNHQERFAVLEAVPPPDADIRRILFYENDRMIGSVDEPPYEWGWQGPKDLSVEFFAECQERSGRRVRSPRQMLPARAE